MRVQWTRRALRRLDQQIGYVAQYSASAATELSDRLFDRAGTLADNPLMGREGRYLGTRELVVEKGRYIIVYRVRSQVVQIVTVHDARQQWPEELKKA